MRLESLIAFEKMTLREIPDLNIIEKAFRSV
jgi:hypothetical protein